MAGESLDGFRSFQDVRLYHALERLESTVESMANLASAVLHIPKQAFALKYKAKPSFMDSRPHGNLKRLESLQASCTDYLFCSNPRQPLRSARLSPQDSRKDNSKRDRSARQGMLHRDTRSVRISTIVQRD